MSDLSGDVKYLSTSLAAGCFAAILPPVEKLCSKIHPIYHVAIGIFSSLASLALHSEGRNKPLLEILSEITGSIATVSILNAFNWQGYLAYNAFSALVFGFIAYKASEVKNSSSGTQEKTEKLIYQSLLIIAAIPLAYQRSDLSTYPLAMVAGGLLGWNFSKNSKPIAVAGIVAGIAIRFFKLSADLTLALSLIKMVAPGYFIGKGLQWLYTNYKSSQGSYI